MIREESGNTVKGRGGQKQTNKQIKVQSIEISQEEKKLRKQKIQQR